MKRICALALILLLFPGVALAATWYPSAQAKAASLRLYDERGLVVFIAVKTVYDPAMANVDLTGFASKGDNIYTIYAPDGSEELVSFVSSTAKFRCMAKGDAKGVLRPLLLSGSNTWVISGSGELGISNDKLKAIMDFFGFSFDTDYPVLDKHIEAKAGNWVVLSTGQPQATAAKKATYRLAPPAVIVEP